MDKRYIAIFSLEHEGIKITWKKEIDLPFDNPIGISTYISVGRHKYLAVRGYFYINEVIYDPISRTTEIICTLKDKIRASAKKTIDCFLHSKDIEWRLSNSQQI